jgi:superfamily II DNA or RNA helicase
MSELTEISGNLGIETRIKDDRVKFNPIDVDSRNIKYKNYQAKGVRALVSGGSEGVLVAPAGSGKTVMGLSLIPLLGQPTVWLTHRDRLMKQVLERSEEFLPSLTEEDKGTIGGGKNEVGRVLTVGMIQTLSQLPKEDLRSLGRRFGMLILDEAHHCPAYTFLEVVVEFSAHYVYGLTATPRRRDGLEEVMFHALGKATAIIEREEVVKDKGMIIPVVKYREVPGRRVNDDNFARILKKHVVNNKERNNMIVSDVIREAMLGNFCIVLSDRRSHCNDLFELIRPAFDKVGIATGKFTKKFVDDQVKLLEEEKITVLVCTSDLLSEGFDVDKLNRGFIASPFRAVTKTEQIVGRLQRPAKNKKDAVIYDYVDSAIGVLASQFYSKNRDDCRYKTYEGLGCAVEPA